MAVVETGNKNGLVVLLGNSGQDHIRPFSGTENLLLVVTKALKEHTGGFVSTLSCVCISSHLSFL